LECVFFYCNFIFKTKKTIMAIPSVNLADFLSGDATKKADFVKKLGDAYEEIGFVAVKNHGIPDHLIAKLYTQVEAFFDLPYDVKKTYEIAGLAGQRGYTSFGKEQAKGFDTPDLKEFYQHGQVVEGDDAIKVEYPENVVIREVDGFTDTMNELYKTFEKSGKALLEAIAIYLKLPENYFHDKIFNGNSILRCIHYPPITSEPKSAIRAEQHEDINLITLLVGASADGLEVLDKKNEWHPAKAEPDEIVVNVGDMLQRLTNNKLRSTTHRVVNPPRELWHTHRYSIPFFLHPRSNVSLACLESCINEANPKQYSDCTAGEYLDERLREIGLKK
jgi:isopenicillin N synthase-like dioxygenase